MQPLAFAIQLHGIQGEDNCEERTGRVKKHHVFLLFSVQQFS